MSGAAVFVPLGLLAIAAAASRSSSSTARGQTSTSSQSRERAAARICAQSAEDLPIGNEATVLQWARCAGRTSGEVEGVAARGAAAGWPSARVDRLRQEHQRAQDLARRPPDPLSPRAQRDVDRALAQSDTQARSRAMAREPESITLDHKPGPAARPSGGGARIERGAAAARAPQERGEPLEAAHATGGGSRFSRGAAAAHGTKVSGTDAASPITSSTYDPKLARRLASQVARAVRERLPGRELNLSHFRAAAGLPMGSDYSPDVEAALRHFGIRNAPRAEGPAATYTPPGRDS